MIPSTLVVIIFVHLCTYACEAERALQMITTHVPSHYVLLLRYGTYINICVTLTYCYIYMCDTHSKSADSKVSKKAIFTS